VAGQDPDRVLVERIIRRQAHRVRPPRGAPRDDRPHRAACTAS